MQFLNHACEMGRWAQSEGLKIEKVRCENKVVGRFKYYDGGGYENSKFAWMCSECKVIHEVK